MMREILVIDNIEKDPFWHNLKAGSKIEFAPTASSGLKMVSTRTGIVFLSMRLRDMDSMEALSTIRALHPSLAVIVVGYCEEICMCMEAFKRGAWDYIRKPLKTEEVLFKIRKVLDSEPAIETERTRPAQAESYPGIPLQFVNGVIKVRDFLEENYSESLTLAAACRMARLSKTYFCRFFKSITGRSLRSYSNFVKMQIAEELLQDKRLSVTEVALRLGFTDSNYFSTTYKKINGVSPRCRKSAGRKIGRPAEREQTLDYSDRQQTC